MMHILYVIVNPGHMQGNLVCHALPITDDSGVSLRRLRPFCVEAGEFDLVTVLYVLYPKNNSKQLKLSARSMLPRDFLCILWG